MIQPIIVALSDKTWHPKFRSRKPYFFIGAVMCSLALFAFQKIKDADIPFIFFDKVPEEKNYNQVSINDAAVKSLNTLKINIP